MIFIPGSVNEILLGWVQSLEQRGLVEGVPARDRGLEQDGPFQPKSFYDFMLDLSAFGQANLARKHLASCKLCHSQ